MIWKRYLMREILKVFVLFLSTFFFLYALLDYSTHMQDFVKDNKIQILDIIYYYGFQFIKRADLLLPLALLLATIKVLSNFNAHRELIALQTAALPLKKLLSPFFIVALSCSLFNYLSFEYITPKTLNFLDKFRQEHFKHTHKGARKEPFHIFHLKDNSKLIYQYFDAEQNKFFDVLWIRSSSDIYRIKLLNADPRNPEAEFVDHLTRNSLGYFEKIESYDTTILNELSWQRNMTQQGIIPFENRKISELIKLYVQSSQEASYVSSEILAHLSFKCLMPLLPFLVVLATAPFCVRYSRRLSLFFIYTFSLFGFLAFFTLMDAAVIVGKNGVVNPFLAISLPFALCGVLFSFKYKKEIL
ncbi:MAG: LptF/LptG family permease [Chlamydiota bacterium]